MIKGLVSIVTPCYNGAKYIAETIDSVIAQTYPQWEMLIVDDGSADNIVEVVRAYTERDPRIRLIRRENGGSAAARNTGLRQTQGQYIALLDADDIWYPTFLEKQIAFLREKNAVCVCCAYERMDEYSRPIGHPTKAKAMITSRDMRILNHIGCLTGLYDASKHGIVYLDESLRYRDDYAHWIAVVDQEGVAYGNPEILARYRVFSDSTTGKKSKLVKIHYRFLREYLHMGYWKSHYRLACWAVMGLIRYR